MRPADSHLTPQEMESLLFGPADPRDSDQGSASAREAQQHLSGCAVCQGVAERYRKADEMLRALRSGAGKASPTSPASAKRRPDCPDEEVWLSWAAGLLTDAEAADYVVHAANCGHCGPLMKEAMEDVAYDLTREEQQALPQLPTASPDWQRQMALKLAAQQEAARASQANAASGSTRTSGETAPQGNQRPATPDGAAAIDRKKPSDREVKKETAQVSRWWPKLAWSAVAAAIVVAVGIFVWLKTREPDVNALLAQAYTEQRTIELRMPGAKYGPMRVERATRPKDLPADFYTAQGLIKAELSKRPDDPGLLQAQARAHLLVWEYHEAEQELEQALAQKPNVPDLLLDKATALYERGADTGDQRKYIEALDLLGRVLRERPDDPVALYNRAILEEETGAYRQAASDWDHYLSVRPDDSWAREAKQRRDQVRKKIAEHETRITTPLLNPSAFSLQLEHDANTGENTIQPRIEDYQQLGLEKWSLLAFDSNGQAATRKEARASLSGLAAELSRRNGDEWLHMLLRTPDSAYFAAGLRSLASAIRAADSNQAEVAEKEAAAAMRHFARGGNSAGVARSAEEVVHALQMQLKYQPCMAESAKWIREIAGRRYSWLETQLESEQAICANGAQEFRRSEWHANRALSLARSHSFPTLELRILGTDAFNLYDRGLEQDGLKETQTGLRRYWESASPPLRGFQFYWNLFTAAEAKGQWEAAIIYGKEAVSEVALTQSKKSEAAARSRLASAATKAGEPAVARAEAKRAEDLIAQNNVDPADPYLLDLRIARAEVELTTGHPAEAREFLKEITPHLEQLDHYAIWLHYYTVLGRVALYESALTESEKALAKAVEIGNFSAQKLKSDEDRVAWERATGPAYRAAVELRMVRGEYAEALSLWEKYRSLSLSIQSSQLENSALPEGTTAVVWALLPDGLAIWLKSGRHMEAAWTPLDLPALESRVARFSELCSSPSTRLDEISLLARQLHKSLFGSVASHLPKNDLLVVEADGVLARIPVQVLENESGIPLTNTHAVVYTLSLQHYLAAGNAVLTTRLDHESRVVIVVSRPDQAGGGNAMVYNAEKEAQAISAHFPGTNPLIGHRGILEETKRKLSGADVFDFVGHSADMRGQAGLMLWSGQDGGAELLRPANLWSQRLHLKLVVLSACSTGKPSEEGLLDANGLVKGFLTSGTTAVVATGWNLDSEVAAEYMDLLYAGLMKGISIPVALEKTQILLRQKRQFVHPYYWASFNAFS